jgi:hypothetical protein
MPHKNVHKYFEKAQELDIPYNLGDDPRPLQTTFAALFDEAAQAVYHAGSDLDEVLVERILLVRVRDLDHEIPAEFLADAVLLRKTLIDHFPGESNSDGQQRLQVVAVKIIACRDQLGQA